MIREAAATSDRRPEVDTSSLFIPKARVLRRPSGTGAVLGDARRKSSTGSADQRSHITGPTAAEPLGPQAPQDQILQLQDGLFKLMATEQQGILASSASDDGSRNETGAEVKRRLFGQEHFGGLSETIASPLSSTSRAPAACVYRASGSRIGGPLSTRLSLGLQTLNHRQEQERNAQRELLKGLESLTGLGPRLGGWLPDPVPMPKGSEVSGKPHIADADGDYRSSSFVRDDGDFGRGLSTLSEERHGDDRPADSRAGRSRLATSSGSAMPSQFGPMAGTEEEGPATLQWSREDGGEELQQDGSPNGDSHGSETSALADDDLEEHSDSRGYCHAGSEHEVIDGDDDDDGYGSDAYEGAEGEAAYADDDDDDYDLDYPYDDQG
ncbi:unnamed protein product [Parajaminaea phylloscopi]